MKKFSFFWLCLLVLNFSFSGCDNFYQKKTPESEQKKSSSSEVKSEKEVYSSSEEREIQSNVSNNEVTFQKIVNFKARDIKIENGSIALNLDITMLDKTWFLYSFDNKAKIGKPFNELFYFVDASGQKNKISGDVFRVTKQEILTVTREAETLDSKEKIEIKVFPEKASLYIEIKSPEIKKNGQKIEMEIDGSMCQKEKNGTEPEICLPVSGVTIGLN